MEIRHVLAVGAMVMTVAVLGGMITGGVVQAQTPATDQQEAPAAPATPPAEPSVPRWDLWSPQARECAEGNGRCLELAILNYASQHEWRLPPDLGATLPYAVDYDRQSNEFRTLPPAEAAKYYLCPPDRARVAIPAEPTPEWINQNTSYAYLGGADVNVDALTEEQFNNAAIIYQRAAPANSEMGGMTVVFPLNGSAPRPQTANRIAWSRQALDATRSVPFAAEGQPALARRWARVQAAPKASECARNQAELGKTLAMYMFEHRGYCPPTLGDTLPYALRLTRTDPLTGQRAPITPREAGAIYLCPLDQDIEIPEDVTPEWINEHSSYVYLGDETVSEAVDPGAVILYERLDRGHADTANLLFADFHAGAHPKDWAQVLIDRSVLVLDDERAAEATGADQLPGNGAAAGTNGATGAAGPGRRARVAIDPNAARLENLRRLMKALVADTQDQRGRLPEGLVHVVKFHTQGRGPKAPWALSPRVAARLLLSPRAQKDLKVPDKPDKRWLEQNGSYAYLADDRLTVDLMRAAIPAAQWPEVVVLHEKPVEGDPQVAVATLDLVCRLVEAKKASEMIERSKTALATARTATASVTSQPTNQASHPVQRWRGKSSDDTARATAAAKTPAQTEAR